MNKLLKQIRDFYQDLLKPNLDQKARQKIRNDIRAEKKQVAAIIGSPKDDESETLVRFWIEEARSSHDET